MIIGDSMYDKPKPSKNDGVDPVEQRELQIVKQAIIKSLIESGAVTECDEKARRIVLRWVSFVRRNGQEEKEAWHPLNF